MCNFATVFASPIRWVKQILKLSYHVVLNNCTWAQKLAQQDLKIINFI